LECGDWAASYAFAPESRAGRADRLACSGAAGPDSDHPVPGDRLELFLVDKASARMVVPLFARVAGAVHARGQRCGVVHLAGLSV